MSRYSRVGRRLALAATALGVGYVALVIHPQPLFAYSAKRQNVVLHARHPFPTETPALLDDVVRRLSASPLYDSQRIHHVFLCDTPQLFAVFALWQRTAGAIAATWANGNAFIRPANISRGRVTGASGIEKGGNRTLAYYVAHELTHSMTADRTGRFGYRRLSAFQTEGYADYVAFAEPVDVNQGLSELRAGSKDMDPALSGHYDRYRLFVGYLLQDRHLPVEELLAQRLDGSRIEAELRALPP